MSIEPSDLQKQVSRRAMLTMIGAAGGAVATACACGTAIGVGALLNRSRDDAESRIVYVTATPENLRYPNMTSRAAWGAKPPNNEALFEFGFYGEDNPIGWREYTEDLREINNTVVVHHSVLYEGDDLDTVREVQRLHQDDRLWADVGYHYLVGKNGMVYEGRPVEVRGVHVGGYNTGTIGVCLLGNFVEDQPTQSQINAAQALIQWLATRFDLSHLAGHKNFNDGTQCPGDNLLSYLEVFATNAGLTVGTEGYVLPEATETARLQPCPCGIAHT